MKTLAKTKLALKRRPRFETDAEGKSKAVRLNTPDYIALLVQANQTDPALWPPGAKQGATALARIRKIEVDCIATHGEFDWEKLSEPVQDEYDSLCVLLDRLQDTGERVSLHAYQVGRGKRRL